MELVIRFGLNLVTAALAVEAAGARSRVQAAFHLFYSLTIIQYEMQKGTWLENNPGFDNAGYSIV
jgi:hypothetical protein